MRHLSLVKKLSDFQDEQKFSQEFVEVGNLNLLRGTLSEFVGLGKTSLVLSLLSLLTQNGEICAVVDFGNSFNPTSAEKNNVALNNLLWIRCDESLEKSFSATDSLVQAKGFGMIWLMLNNLSLKQLTSIPTAYWFRFRTKIKDTPTLMVVTSNKFVSNSASSQVFFLDKYQVVWNGRGRFKLIEEVQINLNTKKPFLFKPTFQQIGVKY